MSGDTLFFGGLTLTEAQALHQSAVAIPWARKNLFHVEMTSPVPIGDAELTFNLFCLSVDYSPIALSGEKRQIGTLFADSVTTHDAIELRITTLDDQAATIQTWFKKITKLAAPEDGTVNPPAKYAITIAIRHAFVDGVKGLIHKRLYRPGSLEISLSRSESAMTELSLSFAELDSFMLAS